MEQARSSVPPRLSLVIASRGDVNSLIACVRSFADQADADALEIVVAHAGADDDAARVRAACPSTRLLHFTEAKSIPELRAAGIKAARAAVVAMTEDHCLAGEDWVSRVLRAHEQPHAAIGGPVENAATDRIVDWAVYFCEYGRYMPPVASGPTDDLPGPNVSYKRAAIDAFRDLLDEGTWEPFWHWRLLDRGATLANDPAVVVYHRKHFTFGGFMRERYHYARSFAASRVAGAGLVRRAAFVLASPLLPPLLVWRLLRQVLGKGRRRRELLLALPLVAAFTLSWAIGELVGYAAGAGDSARKIE